MGTPRKRLVRVTIDGTEVTIAVPLAEADGSGEALEPARMPLDPHWTHLSEDTAPVLRLLCTEATLSRAEIASRLKVSPEGWLRFALRDLVKRRILDASTNDGYWVRIPEDADPPAYRRQLALLIDRLYPLE